jgi:protein involved in ribonucleotide reduction
MKDADARAAAFALWNIAIRRARSEGLYHMEKYITQAGTTPASGTPRKKRPVRSPVASLTAAKHMDTVPKRTITVGKKYFGETFFMAIFAGIRNAVTAKYVIETAQLNWVP